MLIRAAVVINTCRCAADVRAGPGIAPRSKEANSSCSTRLSSPAIRPPMAAGAQSISQQPAVSSTRCRLHPAVGSTCAKASPYSSILRPRTWIFPTLVWLVLSAVLCPRSSRRQDARGHGKSGYSKSHISAFARLSRSSNSHPVQPCRSSMPWGHSTARTLRARSLRTRNVRTGVIRIRVQQTLTMQ